MQNKIYQNIATKPLPNSRVEIGGEITIEALEKFKIKAIDHFKNELSIPGFRKGHVPEKIILEKIGELALLEEAGELALKEVFPEIINETKVDALGMPEVKINKLALGNPMSFIITIDVFPTFTLPDYKGEAKKLNVTKETTEVTEKDIDDTIKEILRMKHKEADGDKDTQSESTDTVPELTDELVKSIGRFENVEDFKNKVKDGLLKEKEFKAKEKIRLETIKVLIDKSNIEIPRILIESELDRMFIQFTDDISRMGMKIDEYLKRIEKTTEDVRREWEKDAKERVSMELILQKIREEEKIEASEEEIEKEVKHLLEHYKDADPVRAKHYFSHLIGNEKVFEFLENQ